MCYVLSSLWDVHPELIIIYVNCSWKIKLILKLGKKWELTSQWDTTKNQLAYYCLTNYWYRVSNLQNEESEDECRRWLHNVDASNVTEM